MSVPSRPCIVAIVVGTIGAARPAEACKMALRPYKPTPIAGDTTPPAAPLVASRIVEPASRSTLGIPIGGCGSCGHIGRIRVTVSGQDDRALPQDLGYRVTVVGDRGGMNMVLDDDPVEPYEGEIVLPFRGDAGFDLTLEIRAVDPSGNVGPPTTHVVRVPAAFPWKWILGVGVPAAIVAAIVVARRRRRLKT